MPRNNRQKNDWEDEVPFTISNPCTHSSCVFKGKIFKGKKVIQQMYKSKCISCLFGKEMSVKIFSFLHLFLVLSKQQKDSISFTLIWYNITTVFCLNFILLLEVLVLHQCLRLQAFLAVYIKPQCRIKLWKFKTFHNSSQTKSH